MIFYKALEEYETFVSVTKSEGTYKYFLGKKNLLLKFLANAECESINMKSLVPFIKQLQTNNPNISNTTINKYLKMIRQILKYSCEIHLEIDKLSETKKIIKTIPQQTINRIFKYYEKNLDSKGNIRNYAMFRLLNDSGLRVNELVNLRLNDIDMRTRTIHVKKTKTNAERYVFFTEDTNFLLHKYIILMRIDGYVFINTNTREKLTVDGVETIATRLRKKLDINQSISPHKWRHTFATKFARANGNMEVLRQIMGHESLKTTQKYLHLDRDSLSIEYNRINNMS